MYFRCSVHTTGSPDPHGRKKDLPKHETSSADKCWADSSISKVCFSKQDFAADNFYGKFPNKMFPKLILTQGMNNFI